jgi:hypothetical protein
VPDLPVRRLWLNTLPGVESVLKAAAEDVGIPMSTRLSAMTGVQWDQLLEACERRLRDARQACQRPPAEPESDLCQFCGAPAGAPPARPTCLWPRHHRHIDERSLFE